MKIRIDKIPPEGIEISGDIDAQGLSLDTESIGFVKPVNVAAGITKTGIEVFVDIRLEAMVEYTCARCLAKFQGALKKEFKIIREAKPSDTLELDDDIRQEIMLECPMKVVCNPDCKGLCPNCGQNLNVEECECVKETRNPKPLTSFGFGASQRTETRK